MILHALPGKYKGTVSFWRPLVFFAGFLYNIGANLPSANKAHRVFRLRFQARNHPAAQAANPDGSSARNNGAALCPLKAAKEGLYAMKLGIVGLPNVGKSTLFNAITNAGAESANYPFCTIDPNVGVVAVPDGRLDWLSDFYTRKRPPRRWWSSWTSPVW